MGENRRTVIPHGASTTTSRESGANTGGIPDFVRLFKEGEYADDDYELVLKIGDEQLKTLGIERACHRRRFLKKFAECSPRRRQEEKRGGVPGETFIGGARPS